MNNETLKAYLTTSFLGKNITYFSQTDSTNTQAKLYCEANKAQEGDIFIAEKQSEGKGTDGNSWSSENGNLLLSIIFNNDKKVTTLFPLYPAVALAKTLKEKYNIDAHVKWPNDVLVGTKKISGILCEGVAGKYMIVGIGVNINSVNFPDKLDKIATSMKLETAQEYIIEEVLNNFLSTYEGLLYNNTDIRQEWLEHTKMLNKDISISRNGEEKIVKIVGLSAEGFLEIETKNGKRETLMARRGLDISTDF